MLMDVLALSELLKPPDKQDKAQNGISSERSRDTQKNDRACFTKLGSYSSNKDCVDLKDSPHTNHDIWNEEDDVNIDNKAPDLRPAPPHQIYFCQSVGTEDVFLGTSEKSPASLDCSHCVIKVHFKGCSIKDIELDVSANALVAESREHILSLGLPVPVIEGCGSAKWDKKDDILIIRLPIRKQEL
mmetsp:Transcript_26329/g.32280  ORF Transcript_26329/g.32280 Transcript_26329/m.32280 type:complete len:186 (-) Transcript_26329:145-702(-)